MKRIYLGLSISILLTGCMSIGPTKEKATIVNVAVAPPGKNLILDPQLTEFRSNKGKSTVWIKKADKKKGLGDAGSSGDTAFGPEGSARFRFVSKTDDFTSQPGLTQQIKSLSPNTNYEFSLYYSDKKGDRSISQLVFGVENPVGKSLAYKKIHVSDLSSAPKGTAKKGFRQVFVSFNSGLNTEVKVYAKLKISKPSKIDTDYDIGKQTEIRVDEFILMQE